MWARSPNNRTQLNKSDLTKLNSLDCFCLGSAAKFNQTKSSGLRSIVPWINSLKQRLCFVVSKRQKTRVILKKLKRQKMCSWFSTPVLPKKKNKSSEIKSLIWFNCPIIFVWVRFGSIAKFNQTQFMDWVWFSSIEFNWNTVWLGAIDYAGCIENVNEVKCKLECILFLQ